MFGDAGGVRAPDGEPVSTPALGVPGGLRPTEPVSYCGKANGSFQTARARDQFWMRAPKMNQLKGGLSCAFVHLETQRGKEGGDKGETKEASVTTHARAATKQPLLNDCCFASGRCFHALLLSAQLFSGQSRVGSL